MEDRELSGLPPLPEDIKSTYATALTLRHNLSLWYEQLDPSKVIPLLKDKLGFSEAQMKKVESYSDHPRAQAAAIFAEVFKPDIKIASLLSLPAHEKLTSQLTEDYQQFLYEEQSKESLSSPMSNLEELSRSFYVLLQDIINCLNEFPNALDMLKQALASLVLPLGDGKVASIIKQSLYDDAKSIVDVFLLLSPFINPLSLSLIQYCVHSTECSSAIAKITTLDHLRTSNGGLILCCDKWTVPTTFDGLNDLNTTAIPGANAAHTASLQQLQSVHPWIFPKIAAAVLPEQCVRISASVNRKSISLAEYDCLLTAIGGFFELPKCAFTYIGCTEQPLCLSWVVSKELQSYAKNCRGGLSGERMLSEQGVVNVMVGGALNYHCQTINLVSPLAGSEIPFLLPTLGSQRYSMMWLEIKCHLLTCYLWDLRQEVTVLAQLSHPNIVALLGVSIRPMCMVIEFAPMGSLFGTLDKTVEQIKQDQADRASVILRMPGGVLGREITMKIALQVALAIRYLHRHSIVYRDLKSDNVLIWSLDVGEPVNAKLADYGISRFANPGGVKGEEGTPGYLAPEAIRRRGEDQAFDEKVDIFSYAMFIFELLTGQRPFESLTTTQELNQAVIKGERPLVNEGNAEPSFPGLMDLMYDCWKHSSSDRPAADEIVQRICEPGFLCRSHTIHRSRDQPLQKIDTIYARPVLADDLDSGRKSYTLWTWARQDQERNFSIIDVRKGVFNLPEKQAPGGRVYAMTATGEVEKRIWIGTADCEIQVYGYKSVGDPQCLWTFTTKDSVLALTTELEGGRVKRVFASLANGTLCIFSRKSISSIEPGPIGDATCIAEACTIKCSDEQFRSEAEDWANPLIMRLGEGQRAAKCMTFVGKDQLWCGCGNTITVVDSNELKVLHHIPVFVRKMALVNELVSAGDRVWGVGRQLSCVMEWDAKTFQLLHIFNANNIDPTNENVITDPKTVEELVDRDRHNSPKAPDTPTDKKLLQSQESFTVENEPIRLQASSAPFSQRTTRRTLREIKPRERSKNIKFQQEGPRSRIYTTRDLVRRRQQGSTRTTSLVIVDRALWVARGMGDVLVIDITGMKSHGKVLARLATEDCEKFGNRSYHKLVQVAGEYVVSSQWLEPVDIRRGSAQGGGDPSAIAHQSITIWEAWSHKKIEQFMTQRASMLMLEEEETV